MMRATTYVFSIIHHQYLVTVFLTITTGVLTDIVTPVVNGMNVEAAFSFGRKAPMTRPSDDGWTAMTLT